MEVISDNLHNMEKQCSVIVRRHCAAQQTNQTIEHLHVKCIMTQHDKIPILLLVRYLWDQWVKATTILNGSGSREFARLAACTH